MKGDNTMNGINFNVETAAKIADLMENDTFLTDLNEHEAAQEIILAKYLPREKPYTGEESFCFTVMANDLRWQKNSPDDKATLICAMAEIVDRAA